MVRSSIWGDYRISLRETENIRYRFIEHRSLLVLDYYSYAQTSMEDGAADQKHETTNQKVVGFSWRPTIIDYTPFKSK